MRFHRCNYSSIVSAMLHSVSNEFKLNFPRYFHQSMGGSVPSGHRPCPIARGLASDVKPDQPGPRDRAPPSLLGASCEGGQGGSRPIRVTLTTAKIGRSISMFSERFGERHRQSIEQMHTRSDSPRGFPWSRRRSPGRRARDDGSRGISPDCLAWQPVFSESNPRAATAWPGAAPSRA